MVASGGSRWMRKTGNLFAHEEAVKEWVSFGATNANSLLFRRRTIPKNDLIARHCRFVHKLFMGRTSNAEHSTSMMGCH
jgi:hypothetical protein